jgi:hypothetical protein
MPPNNVNDALEQNKGRKLQTGSKDDQHKFKRCGVKYTAAGREFSVFEVLFDTFHGILVHLLHILRYFRTLAFKKKWASSCRRPGRKAWQCNARHSQAVRFGYLREVRVKACSADGILVFTDDRCPFFALPCERKISPFV